MNKYRALGVAWLLVAAACGAYSWNAWFVQGRQADSDILSMLPQSAADPLRTVAMQKMVASAEQQLFVLVGHNDWQKAKAAAAAYRDVLKSHPDVFRIQETSGNNETAMVEFFARHRGVLLSAADRTQIKQRSADDWATLAWQKLFSPALGVKYGTWTDDPFGLYANWLIERAASSNVRVIDDELRVDRGELKYVLLAIGLTESAFAFSTQKSAGPILQNAIHAALTVTPEVEIISAGVLLHAMAAAEQAHGEITTIGIGSAAGILLLIWLVFGSLRPIALVLLSIVVGLLGALTVSLWLFEQVHLLTLVFGASLIGVSMDYSMHYLTRVQSAQTREECAAVMRVQLPGLGLALASSVLAYLGLALMPFPGLQQMAVFAASGLVFAWLTMALLLPQLVAINGQLSALALRFSGLRARLPQWNMRDRGLLIMGLLLMIGIVGISRVQFNDDIRNLQTSPMHLIESQMQFSEIVQTPSPAQFYLLRAASEQSLLELEENLRTRLDKLVSQKELDGYLATSTWVPSQMRQRLDNALIEKRLYDNAGAVVPLAELLGEDQTFIEASRERLLVSSRRLQLSAVLEDQASAPWRGYWLGEVNNEYASVVALRGVNSQNIESLRQQTDGLDGVIWVDRVGDISTLMAHYRVQMLWGIGAAYLLIFGLLSLRYRRKAWRVIFPAALASVLTIAALSFFAMPIQLFHVLALLLVLGMGVDYGIFLQEHPERSDGLAWLAVSVAATSTILAFGLLALSQTPALQAFGLTLLIGILIVWITAPLLAAESTLGKTSNAN